MADIRLAKPAAGAAETVPCEPSARFVFDFPTSDATLARDGDNLNISFEDGSKLQLQDFYKEYNEENLPSFSVDGTDVAAADFFEAMNEPDLMPAAGPATGTVANGARFHEWGGSDLTGGIEHLNGLDWGFSRAFEWDDVPNAVGYHHDDEGDWQGVPVSTVSGDTVPVNHPVTITPENPGSVPPETVFPGDDSSDIAPHGDVRLVLEKDLRDAKTTSVEGSLKVDAPDGLAAIEIDGVPIWQNGQMVSGLEFSAGEGKFHNFGYDAATGRLTYTYTLNANSLEHSSETGPDHIAYSLPVTVRDVDGDIASSSITIVIEDDVPDLRVTYSDDKEKTGFMYGYDKASGMKADFTAHEQDSQIDRFEDAGFSTSDAFYFSQDKDTRSPYSWQAEAKKPGEADTENVAYITKYVDPDDTTSGVAFKMTASAVHYKYVATEDGQPGQLQVETVVDINNLVLNFDKSLCITEEGLGVGNNIGDRSWNTGMGGISPYKTDVPYTKVNPKNGVDEGDNGDFTRLINASDWGVQNRSDSDIINLEKLNNAYEGEKYGVRQNKQWEYSALDNQNISEAIIFDLADVSYGVNLDLGNMRDSTGQGYERVLVTFLMTPVNSNDDVIVDMKEIPINELTPTKGADGKENWNWEHHVEAGFTKVFVSAIRTGDHYTTNGFSTNATANASGNRVDNADGFTIRGVEFLTAVWKTAGDVEAVSADGTGAYEWDWSAFIPANGGDKTPEGGEDPVGDNTSEDSETSAGGETPAGSELPPDSVDAVVHVKGIKGGDYAVTWDKAKDGSLSCKLGQKKDGQELVDGDLTNRTLFTVTLDPTNGQWTVAQYFEFATLAFLAGTDLEGPFRITVEDGDGDRTTKVLDIDAQFVRFGEQLTGHYEEAWLTDATRDQAADILVGSELENSLIYGKGGDDVLIGDKFEADGADPLQQLLAGAKTSTDVDSSDGHHHHNILNAMAGKDVSKLAENIESEESGDDALFGGTGNDILFGGGGNDELHGNEGNDILFGGSGEDYLYGDAGNDYLHGGTGADYLYGGAGNDLIVYDATDYLIDGGADIDFLLAGQDDTLHLGDLLTSPKVNDVEVLIKGADALSLTNMEDLAKLGITMSPDGKSMTLSDKWTSDGKPVQYGDVEVTTWTNDTGLTLETTLHTDDPATQAAHTLELTSNG